MPSSPPNQEVYHSTPQTECLPHQYADKCECQCHKISTETLSTLASHHAEKASLAPPIALKGLADTSPAVVPLEERGKAKIIGITGTLALAVFLAALDMTITATALPTIAEDLQANEIGYTWIGSAYLLACCAGTTAWGKISDIFGRKPILLMVTVVFFVGSLICGLSPNMAILLSGRAIQGIGGGGLLTLVNICIADLVSPRNRGVYYGFIGAVWATAGSLGPVIGGLFSEYVTWRWCFYINLPCAFISFIILFFLLDIHTPRTPIIKGLLAIDWLGIILIVSGTVMFLIGLEIGGVNFPWNSPIVICLIVFGLLTLLLFFIVQGKLSTYPLMPIRLFRSKNTLAAFGVGFCHSMVYIVVSYFLPLYFQAVLKSNPLMSGVELLPFVCGIAATSLSVGPFIKRTGRVREPIWCGLPLFTLCVGLFIVFTSDAHWGVVVTLEILAGIGAGPVFQAPLIALQGSIDQKDIATATATFNFLRQLASSIGLVIGGVIFQNSIHDTRSGLPQADQDKIRFLSTDAIGSEIALPSDLSETTRGLIASIYTKSLQNVWAFCAAFVFLAWLMSLFIKKTELSKQHTVQKLGLEQEALRRKKEHSRDVNPPENV